MIVDDSTSLDQEVFNMEAYEGADWVRISDDVPVDEERRDQLLETFQTHYHPGAAARSPRPRSSRATRSSTRTRTARTRARGLAGEARDNAPTSSCPTRTATRSAPTAGETVVLTDPAPSR